MIEFYEKFMTKAEVDGVKELIDLTHNGYVVTFSSKILTACAFGLRHRQKTNILHWKVSLSDQGEWTCYQGGFLR